MNYSVLNISTSFRVFRKRVTSMMDTLYQQDKEETFKILQSMETVWKIQAKPIFFAYEFEMYDVIAHPCSVALMDNMWYNGLIPDFREFIKNIKVFSLHFYKHISNIMQKAILIGHLSLSGFLLLWVGVCRRALCDVPRPLASSSQEYLAKLVQI